MTRMRGVSVNKFIEEMATATLSAYDAEVRFRLMAARGRPERGLAILDRSDALGARKGLAEARRPFRTPRRKATKRK